MKPYNVEIFRPDFTLAGNTNVNMVSYSEDYLSSDENDITVFSLSGIEKEDYIRISRDDEELTGVITAVSYGTDNSKKQMVISFKPLMELFNTDVLFDVSLQGVGSIEEFIEGLIRRMFIENEDTYQNIVGLETACSSYTPDWGFHITPSEKGGHYNVVGLLDSVIIPAMEKYQVFVRPRLDITRKRILTEIGRNDREMVTIEADLPNVLSKNITIKHVDADVNKLIIFDAEYENTRTYYLHSDLGYDTYDRDRLTPVRCEMRTVTPDEGTSFDSAAIALAGDVFEHISYKNLIELSMMNGDLLIKPHVLDFGQRVRVISDGISYESILTGK